MIYIIEVPHQRVPKCWVADDKSEATTLIETSAHESFFEEVTVRDLLQQQGLDSLEEAVETNEGDYDFIIEAARNFGLDAKLYKAYTDDEYSSTKPDLFSAALNYNERDLSRQIVLMSDEEALERYDDEQFWSQIHQGLKARDVLGVEIKEISRKA